ncbi:hypothetical protein CsSME_00044810 [Camellia sinensis var. sinensis]
MGLEENLFVIFGRLQLSDTSNESSNILVFQISGRISFRIDVAFVSGTGLKDSRLKERLSSLTDYKCLIRYETSL